MKNVVILLVSLVLLSCVSEKVQELSETEFELSPFKYELVRSFEFNADVIVLTSDQIEVDQPGLCDFLTRKKCSIYHVDTEKIVFSSLGDRETFIKRNAKKLASIVK